MLGQGKKQGSESVQFKQEKGNTVQVRVKPSEIINETGTCYNKTNVVCLLPKEHHE